MNLLKCAHFLSEWSRFTARRLASLRDQCLDSCQNSAVFSERAPEIKVLQSFNKNLAKCGEVETKSVLPTINVQAQFTPKKNGCKTAFTLKCSFHPYSVNVFKP